MIEAGRGGGGRCISMASVLNTFIAPPVDFPVGPEGGIMFREIAPLLRGAAPVQ